MKSIQLSLMLLFFHEIMSWLLSLYDVIMSSTCIKEFTSERADSKWPPFIYEESACWYSVDVILWASIPTRTGDTVTRVCVTNGKDVALQHLSLHCGAIKQIQAGQGYCFLWESCEIWVSKFTDSFGILLSKYTQK